MKEITEEQKAYIKKELEPYCFKDVDVTDFYRFAGAFPAEAMENLKKGLDDLARMLLISRSDIGMNGMLTLKLGMSKDFNRSIGLSNEAGGYYRGDTKEIGIRSIYSKGFAHEWGHALDDLLGNYYSNRPLDAPTYYYDWKKSSRLSSMPDKFLFPNRYYNDCHAYHDETYKDYVQNRTEMFARAVATIPSLYTFDPKVDFTFLAQDHRSPYEIIEETGGNITPEMIHQNQYTDDGFPVPYEMDRLEIYLFVETTIEKLEKEDIFHHSILGEYQDNMKTSKEILGAYQEDAEFYMDNRSMYSFLSVLGFSNDYEEPEDEKTEEKNEEGDLPSLDEIFEMTKRMEENGEFDEREDIEICAMR